MFREGTILRIEGKYNIIRLRDGTSHHTVLNASSVPIKAGDVVVCEEIDQNPTKMVIIGVYKEFTSPDPPEPVNYLCYRLEINQDGDLIAYYNNYDDFKEIGVYLVENDLVVTGDSVTDAWLEGSNLIIESEKEIKIDCPKPPDPDPREYICFHAEIRNDGFLYAVYNKEIDMDEIILQINDGELIVSGYNIVEAYIRENNLYVTGYKPFNTKC